MVSNVIPTGYKTKQTLRCPFCLTTSASSVWPFKTPVNSSAGFSTDEGFVCFYICAQVDGRLNNTHLRIPCLLNSTAWSVKLDSDWQDEQEIGTITGHNTYVRYIYILNSHCCMHASGGKSREGKNQNSHILEWNCRIIIMRLTTVLSAVYYCSDPQPYALDSVRKTVWVVGTSYWAQTLQMQPDGEDR